MKKIILCLLVTFGFINAHAQITVAHTSSLGSNIAQAILFSANGTKIMINDTGTNTIKLYNSDYSIWKTIPVPIFPGRRFAGTQLVSDRLFNSDDQVEAIVYYSSTAAPYYNNSLIISETGSTVYDLGNFVPYNVIYNGGTHQLVTYNYQTLQNVIYSLPGELPCGHCGAGGVGIPKTASSGGGPIAYPVPAGNTIMIQHNLPLGSSGILMITSAEGRMLGSWPVSGRQPQLAIDVTAFAPGFYTFSVLPEGGQPSYGSFVK